LFWVFSLPKSYIKTTYDYDTNIAYLQQNIKMNGAQNVTWSKLLGFSFVFWVAELPNFMWSVQRLQNARMPAIENPAFRGVSGPFQSIGFEGIG